MSQDIGNTIDGEANRPYHFESEVWGQSLELYAQNGMLLVTASDFDSGQTVRIGLKTDQIDSIIRGLHHVVADMKKLESLKADREQRGKDAKAAYKKAKHDGRALTRGEIVTEEKHDGRAFARENSMSEGSNDQFEEYSGEFIEPKEDK